MRFGCTRPPEVARRVLTVEEGGGAHEGRRMFRNDVLAARQQQLDVDEGERDRPQGNEERGGERQAAVCLVLVKGVRASHAQAVA